MIDDHEWKYSWNKDRRLCLDPHCKSHNKTREQEIEEYIALKREPRA
jgi:hypothetical protein